MTPFYDQFGDDRELARRRARAHGGTPPSRPGVGRRRRGGPRDAARQQQFVRRRLVALGAAILLIVLLIAVAAGGSSSPRPTATHVTSIVRSDAVEAEQARESRAIASVLSYTNYIRAGSRGKREIALTFDDGPGPYTPQFISLLQQMHVPATFFVVGRSLHDFGSEFPAEVNNSDFAIGDHTENHHVMGALPAVDQLNELLTPAQTISSYGAPFPRLFRPPYGSFNNTTLALTQRLGMLMVLWSVDTRDFRQPGVSAIVDTALRGARPGAIILMHDAGGPRSQTLAALPTIVKTLRQRHYDLVTVPRLLMDDPPPANQPPPVNLSGLAGGG